MKPRKFIPEDQFRAAVTASFTKYEAMKKLSIPGCTPGYRRFNYFADLYDVDLSHFGQDNRVLAGKRQNGDRIPLDLILSGQFPLYPGPNLAKRLLASGTFERRCANCRNTEWCGQPVPLELDHINGTSWDHRRENLRFLCRNCHGITPTYGGRNKGFGRKTRPEHLRNAELPVGARKRTRVEYAADQRAAYVASQQHLIPLVEASGIDFSKHGWVTKLAPVIGQKPQKVRKWVETVMPELLDGAHRRGQCDNKSVMM